MSSLNHSDKLTLDAFSDPQLQSQNANGVYNRFTNRLRTPVLNAKSIQLLSANFVNSRLQLDDNAQLCFFYFLNNTTNLGLVRLHTSNFIPNTGLTAFVRNRYYNSVVELVAALNQAASTGGDLLANNGLWYENQVQFTYDTTTRKITVASRNASMITPCGADDPILLGRLPTLPVVMNSIAGNVRQPVVPNQSMNARLGFAMSAFARGAFTTTSVPGAAWSRQVFTAGLIEADAFPILLSSQNISFYLSIINGSGMDASGRKNLLETVPISVAPLNIQNFHSITNNAMSVPSEIFECTIEMLDDYGNPFNMPPNFDVSVALGVFY